MKRLFTFFALFAALSMPTLQTAQAQTINESTTGNGLIWPKLKRGAGGKSARTLQRLLRARGYRVAVDSRFGAGTFATVKKYQKARGLVRDGIVGAYTWEALTPNLKRGNRGEAVRALQELLNDENVPVRVDGIFGAQTETALARYYRKRGLVSGAPRTVDDTLWCELVGGYVQGD